MGKYIRKSVNKNSTTMLDTRVQQEENIEDITNKPRRIVGKCVVCVVLCTQRNISMLR